MRVKKVMRVNDVASDIFSDIFCNMACSIAFTKKRRVFSLKSVLRVCAEKCVFGLIAYFLAKNPLSFAFKNCAETSRNHRFNLVKNGTLFQL